MPFYIFHFHFFLICLTCLESIQLLFLWMHFFLSQSGFIPCQSPGWEVFTVLRAFERAEYLWYTSLIPVERVTRCVLMFHVFVVLKFSFIILLKYLPIIKTHKTVQGISKDTLMFYTYSLTHINVAVINLTRLYMTASEWERDINELACWGRKGPVCLPWECRVWAMETQLLYSQESTWPTVHCSGAICMLITHSAELSTLCGWQYFMPTEIQAFSL